MKKSVAGMVVIASIASVSVMADMQKCSIELGFFESENSAFKQVKIPMERALKIALGESPGQVLSAKLEKDEGCLVYEVKVVDASGEEVEYDIDPVTGEILDTESE